MADTLPHREGDSAAPIPALGDNFRLLRGDEPDQLVREWLEMTALQHFRRFGYWPGERR